MEAGFGPEMTSQLQAEQIGRELGRGGPQREAQLLKRSAAPHGLKQRQLRSRQGNGSLLPLWGGDTGGERPLTQLGDQIGGIEQWCGATGQQAIAADGGRASRVRGHHPKR